MSSKQTLWQMYADQSRPLWVQHHFYTDGLFAYAETLSANVLKNCTCLICEYEPQIFSCYNKVVELQISKYRAKSLMNVYLI